MRALITIAIWCVVFALPAALLISRLDLESFAAVGVTLVAGAPFFVIWFEGSPELTGLPRLPWQRDRSAH